MSWGVIVNLHLQSKLTFMEAVFGMSLMRDTLVKIEWS